jgi:hypothetical protein
MKRMPDVAATVKRLDEDTAMVSLGGDGPNDAGALSAALREAEGLGTPGLVIDLSRLAGVGPDVVASVSAFQRHCIDSGRWLLVVPPCAALADYLTRL